MSKLFVSYAREDVRFVQRLEWALTAHGVALWRDQESLHGGQQWPKAIGEAIAANDVVLLVWSQHAVASYFAETEWNIAVALKKTIIPCLLDDTPLPPTLRAINSIDACKLADALPKILQVLPSPGVETDLEHTHGIIAKLAEITPEEPEKVANTLRTAFAQHEWSVRGNVTQITGDVHLSMQQPDIDEKKRWFEKWPAWVAFCAALFAIIVGLLDLPKKMRETFQPNRQSAHIMQTLSGVIWDENHQPLPGVEVLLPEFDLSTTTDRNGRFAFQVKASKQQSVNFIARKEGFTLHDIDPTLGNTSLNFTMRRER